MKAKTIQARSAAGVGFELAKVLGDGYQPTLAFVFLTNDLDIRDITAILAERGIAVIGATAAAGFIDGEYHDDSYVVILLVDMNPSSFRVLYEKVATPDETGVMAKHMAAEALESFADPAFIVLASGKNIEMEELIRNIEAGLDKTVFISGARAANSSFSDQTLVFTADAVLDSGIIVLTIDRSKVSISGLTSHGWKPLGNEHVVTKSSGRTVYAIDGEPALNVFIKYLGVNLENDQSGTTYNIDQLGPVQLIRTGGNNVIRDVSYFDRTERSVIFQSNMPEGTRFRFSLPPDFDMIEVFPDDCRKFKNESQAGADALVLFSCSGRKRAFGPMIREEVEKIKNVWGSPMAGFFSYGEIGRSSGGNNEFHNYTSCLVILNEK